MPSKTIDDWVRNLVFSGLSIEQMDKLPKWFLSNIDKNLIEKKQQLLQDLTEMSETTHVFPKGFKPGDEPVEKKSVPLSRLKQYLNIEGENDE